eukprot:2414128-Rhodomonas_salina.1
MEQAAFSETVHTVSRPRRFSLSRRASFTRFRQASPGLHRVPAALLLWPHANICRLSLVSFALSLCLPLPLLLPSPPSLTSPASPPSPLCRRAYAGTCASSSSSSRALLSS